jgi:hypothetical protein
LLALLLCLAVVGVFYVPPSRPLWPLSMALDLLPPSRQTSPRPLVLPFVALAVQSSQTYPLCLFLLRPLLQSPFAASPSLSEVRVSFHHPCYHPRLHLPLLMMLVPLALALSVLSSPPPPPCIAVMLPLLVASRHPRRSRPQLGLVCRFLPLPASSPRFFALHLMRHSSVRRGVLDRRSFWVF